MFCVCESLTSIDLSNFDTSNSTDISGMFCGCSSLTALDLSNFDTSEVTNMRQMFDWLPALSSLNISSFNTSNVTDMRAMLRGLAVTELDLSNFNISKVTSFSYYDENENNGTWKGMFEHNYKLKTIYVSTGTDWSSITESTNMFQYCASLVGVNGTTYDSSHTDATYARVDGLDGKAGDFTAM